MNFKRLIVTIFVFLLITAMVMPLINAFEATQNPTKSTSTNNFNNADYAYSDGDGYANTINPTQNATYYGYNFNIAAGNLVNGITVQLDAWQSGGAGKGYLDVQLSNDGGSTWTTARRIPSTGFLATTETTYYAGDSSDTWGLSWTIAQLNSDAFRVRVTAQKDGGSNPAWRLDWIPVTVTYSEPTQTDTTPPTTAISLSGTPGNNGWYKSNVQVTLTATDNTSGSGVKEIHYIINGGTEVTNTSNPTVFTIASEGTNSLSYWAVDNAGNDEAANSATIKIDKTPPVITITAPADGAKYVLNQEVYADWGATDAISGVASSSGTVASGIQIDTSTIGTHSFTVNAEDNAGNTETKTVSYSVIYNFGGFLPPIGVDGQGLFKAGSTVPVKFRLTDYNGVPVSTATATLCYRFISGSVIGSDLEAGSTSAATTGNLFRYDSIGQQYIFNWGTKGLTAGSYQIAAYLDDGQVYTARVSLKK